MEIKPQTLIVAIQCVASEIKRIDKLLADDEPENAAQLEELLVTFDLALDNLKAAYHTALDQFSDLPSYESLVA